MAPQRAAAVMQMSPDINACLLSCKLVDSEQPEESNRLGGIRREAAKSEAGRMKPGAGSRKTDGESRKQ